MPMVERARKRLSKKTATKLSVGIVPAESAEASDPRRWLSQDQTDKRLH